METTSSSRGGVPQVLPSQALRKLLNKTSNPPRKASPSGHLVSHPHHCSLPDAQLLSSSPSGARLQFSCRAYLDSHRPARRQTTGTRSPCTSHPSGKTANASNVGLPRTICLVIFTHTELFQVEFDPGCEAMIYTVDGTPLQGMPVL
jgi:hypothetical protein